MSRKRRNIEHVAQKLTQDDAKWRTENADQMKTVSAQRTLDSFVNFAQKLGIGAQNPLSTGSYGFNPITRVRTLLEWMHRGSWLCGIAVDCVADDMTKMGVDIHDELEPADLEKIHKAAIDMRLWERLNETVKWARLYGGCLAFMMIDGQRPETPLRIDSIGKDQFKGLLVLDRWMVDASLGDLITDYGPNIGMPKFYRIVADAPALPRMTIHHSRVIRIDGITLPYWQRVQENLWSESVLERINDRMIAFDSATTGAAQLVYKAYIRTYKVEGLRDIAATGGPALAGLVAYIDMMRNFQGQEGVTLMDSKDEFEGHETSAFTGLSEALTQFAQQLSGALQVPLVRLFGQSPSGFSTGDADMRMYYDTIKQQQERQLRPGLMVMYQVLAKSLGLPLTDGFNIEFRNLWQMDDKTKSEVANTNTDSIIRANEAGLMSDKTAMMEMRQQSHTTGMFTNITDEDIEKASDTLDPPLAESVMPGAENADPKPEKGVIGE